MTGVPARTTRSTVSAVHLSALSTVGRTSADTDPCGKEEVP